MASGEERNDIAKARNMTAQAASYERRAAGAIRQLVAGPSADKLTARAFGCSVRMAQHLRAGQHWTIQRLSQASAVFGATFDVLLHQSSDAQHYAEMADIRDIAERLARLEDRVDAGMVGAGP